MPSRVVGRTVLNGSEGDTEDTDGGLVGVLNISVVGVTDNVETNGGCVDSEIG